jgi:ribonuclease R
LSRKNTDRRGRNDPHSAREARRYSNPIPSREFIMGLMEEEGRPLKFQEVASLLELDEDDTLEALRRRLRAMERDGQVIRNRRDGFCLVNKQDLVAGRVIGHPDGFGFLVPDEGGEDLFLSPGEMRVLMHADRAVVRVSGIDRRGRREGAMVEILERNTHQVVGRYLEDAGVGVVAPDNKRLTQEILVLPDARGDATDGQMVVAEILEYPSRRRPAMARVVEILGEHRAPGMETDVAIRTHEIPVEWPEGVEAEVDSLSEAVPEQAKQGRKDLRKLPLVTIDGEDARDFDDAVHCQRTASGWKLIVAIADVSSYVVPGTALDGEARSRGNSVYFPDRVIPMLPEVLSNGLCSLNPAVDRLCMVAELLIGADGQITRSRFYEAVMHSHARLTYNKVAAMLVDGDEGLRKQYAAVVPCLEELHALFRVLVTGRAARGAIDFETVETRIVFGDGGKIADIVPVVRNDAHRIIEECMLAANVAAARFLQRKKIPALYRIHEGPTREKLSDLREFLGELGLSLGGGEKPQAGDYARLLSSVKGRPDTDLIQTVMLRSLAQAVYSTENAGHFGLSYAAYTHFTSPIRRYPDLLVHRAIRHAISGGNAENFDYSGPELAALGEHCSATERRADDATRDALDTLKCEYMLDKVGETFDGIVSGVTAFGIFVQLTDVYVDGLVHITALDRDYYHFDPVGHRLVGERTGGTYRLGDTLQVVVAAVNLDDRKIDFVLPGSDESDDRKSRPKGPGRGGRKRGSRKRRRQ